ncbi:cytochrome d ubiquinol oxidase subunit II [Bradyrhizobium diazoefficiens]|uniref:cytochrome d ubiquinol oxidase subunit II n=1 Tax=Bradyrhizobium diazoefficiens TaxID=1355477 RepID=UPI001909EDD5|nr:cytochrome d ubiquinol oxidase subunit II [Bradyrhizobium diazoefficiens]MBK3665004.1 cytochrome d ubiquinol oxidase subunit II [Bradyrhizobium diazoefficiens]
MILFWAGLLAVTTSLYVLLDGFDLGVGILFAFADEPNRRKMLSAISPVWDGNETWLVLTGTILFGAFPAAYAALLSTFYLALVLMLCALILRGVAFEFRYKARGFRWFWDLGFAGGSLVATFVQGMTIGALVEGLPMENGHYVGGALGWLSPFAVLCGVGLVLGYSLLGAGWLVRKCEDPIRAFAYRMLPILTVGVLVFLACAFVASLVMHLELMQRWLERPYLLVFPLVGAVATWGLLRSVKQRDDFGPFRFSALIFMAAFGTLAVSFWPFMIPFVLTVEQAASPPSSLAFMFWGAGLFVMPLTLIYTTMVYRLFRGKVVEVHYD